MNLSARLDRPEAHSGLADSPIDSQKTEFRLNWHIKRLASVELKIAGCLWMPSSSGALDGAKLHAANRWRSRGNPKNPGLARVGFPPHKPSVACGSILLNYLRSLPNLTTLLPRLDRRPREVSQNAFGRGCACRRARNTGAERGVSHPLAPVLMHTSNSA
jgi:hypothetical protein